MSEENVEIMRRAIEAYGQAITRTLIEGEGVRPGSRSRRRNGVGEAWRLIPPPSRS